MDHGKSRIQIVHNIADQIFIGVSLDENPILSGIPYKSVTDYILVNSGKHILRAGIECPPGTKCEIDPSAERFSTSGLLNLEPQVSYTIIIHGKDRADFLVLEDDLNCPNDNKAYIRFIHAAADLPKANVYIDGRPLFLEVKYEQTGYPTYISVLSDMHEMNISVDGKDLGADVYFHPQQIYTIILSGTLNDRIPIDAIITEDSHGMCIII